jgi:chromosome condensin MukBEF ATPase and DNA-binding subunit MukB
MKEKIKRRNKLEAFVNSKEAEVEQLKRQVSDGRMHVRQLENVLDAQINQLHAVYEREKMYQAQLQVHFDQLTNQVGRIFTDEFNIIHLVQCLL